MKTKLKLNNTTGLVLLVLIAIGVIGFAHYYFNVIEGATDLAGGSQNENSAITYRPNSVNTAGTPTSAQTTSAQTTSAQNTQTGTHRPNSVNTAGTQTTSAQTTSAQTTSAQTDMTHRPHRRTLADGQQRIINSAKSAANAANAAIAANAANVAKSAVNAANAARNTTKPRI